MIAGLVYLWRRANEGERARRAAMTPVDVHPPLTTIPTTPRDFVEALRRFWIGEFDANRRVALVNGFGRMYTYTPTDPAGVYWTGDRMVTRDVMRTLIEQALTFPASVP